MKKLAAKKLRQKFNHYRDKQEYTPGILLLRQWLITYPDEKDALSMLGELLDKRGQENKDKIDLKESEAIYDRLIKKYPKYNGGYFGKIRFLIRRKDKRAFTLAKKYIGISNDKAYNMYIGHCYRNFGDLKNAEKFYLLAYKHIKGHYGSDYALATLYNEKGNKAKAKLYAEWGIKKWQKMPIRYRKSSLTKKNYQGAS
ncbi:MAG: hypothetical protein NTX82_07185 [Candidatus Parcubacteria bacterium]|nr:hypothetical protein [Candidatus Parcubacteria bacterium]